MSNFENDILRPITDNEIPYFIDIVQKRTPYTIRAYHFLLTQYNRKRFLKHPENVQLIGTLSTRSIFNLFTHRHRRTNCTFIGITDEGNKDNIDDYTVFVYSLQESNVELSEIIRQTRRINWHLEPRFHSIENQHLVPIMDVMSDRRLTIKWMHPNICFCLRKEKALTINYKIPNDVYIARLKMEHVKVINDNFPIKPLGMLHFIETELKLNWGLGVFKTDTNQLVSWVLNNEYYACSAITTLESERGHGYEEILLAAFCKMFAEQENLNVITFVKVDTPSSRKMFDRLGFKEFNKCTWLKMKKIS